MIDVKFVVGCWWGVDGGELVRVEIKYIVCLWFKFNSSVKGRDDIFR